MAACYLEPFQNDHGLGLAHQVTLRPWGRPLEIPPLLESNIPQQLSNQWPSPGTLLILGKLVEVPGQHHNKKRKKQHYYFLSSNNGRTFYYQVVQVMIANPGDLTNNDPPPIITNQEFFASSPPVVYISNSNTSYRLETLWCPWNCPQLPSFVSNNTTTTTTTTTNPPTTKKNVDNIFSPPPHPNLLQLNQALELFSDSSSSSSNCTPSQRLLLLLGNHGMVDLIETAAAMNGRQCLWIDGLAAHAHRCLGLSRSASLMDQLAGLRVALQQAYAAAPSLLALFNFDWDVTTDEESRFLSLLLEKPSSHRPQDGIDITDETSCCLVPSVIIILSMSRMPTKGPLLEHLVWEPITISLPDERYAEYLWWSEAHRCCRDTQNDETMSMMEESRPATNFNARGPLVQSALGAMLKGRTVEEITHLAKQVTHDYNEYHKNNSNSEEPDMMALLEARLQEHNNKLIGRGSSSLIPQVKWSDIGGLEHVRNEILEAIELPLLHPHLFSTGTSSQPKCRRSGILLYGPPGTGKTLVAKAVASECRLPFLSVKGPELLGSFVGESEANVRGVFAQARELATQSSGAVLFFDELDSLAPRRADGGGNSGASVMDRVVATFFTELDRSCSLPNSASIFCIGATNRPDILDPALLRPGRFDRTVYLGLSSSLENSGIQHELQILQVHLSKLCLPPDENPSEMALAVLHHIQNKNNNKATLLTGADLASIASSAMLSATQRLCDEAQMLSDQEGLSVDEILDKYYSSNNNNEEEEEGRPSLEPVVLLKDLIQAAEELVPSVSPDQLLQYQQFLSTRITPKIQSPT